MDLEFLKTEMAFFRVFIDIYSRVPSRFWLTMWPLLLMAVAAYPVMIRFRILREVVHARVDRWFLAPLFGMGMFTMTLLALNAVLGVPIRTWTVYAVVLAVGAVGWTLALRQGVDWKGTWRHRHWFVAVAFLIILILGAFPRFRHTLGYPDRLCDSDPYRHYPRTEWIVQTGNIARHEPWLVGQAPIYEAQGCYVLAAAVSVASGCDSWHVWKYLSPFLGAWSALALYLLVAYLIPGRVNRLGGLLAAAGAAAFSVHLTRTNMGFSEPWALPFLPLTLLALIWTFRYRSFGAGVLFGLFYLFLAWSNMVPAVMLLGVMLPYCGWQLARWLTWDIFWALKTPAPGEGAVAPDQQTRPRWRVRLAPWGWDFLKTYGGLLAAVGIFCVFLLIWNFTYAAIPLNKGARAHNEPTESAMAGSYGTYRTREIGKAKENPNYLATEEAKIAGKGAFALAAAKRLGSFDGEIALSFMALNVDMYIRWFNLKWGLLAFFFCMVMPWGRPPSALVEGADPEAPKGRWKVLALALAPWRSMGGWPRSQWLDTKVFLFCMVALPMLHLYYNEALVNMGIVTFQSKLYRLLVLPAYGLSAVMAVAGAALIGVLSVTVWALATGVSSAVRSHMATRLAQEQERQARQARMEKKKRRKAGAPRRAEAAEGADGPVLPVVVRPSQAPKVVYRIVRDGLMLFAFAVVCYHTYHARGYGSWIPQTTPGEEQALRWIIPNLPERAVFFSEWYHADFIRTYTAEAGRPIPSVLSRIRPDVLNGVQSTSPPLEMPSIRTEQAALDYIAMRRETEPDLNFYVYRSFYGPGYPSDTSAHFTLIGRWRDHKATTSIFAWNGNPVTVAPRESTDPVPIGDSEIGEIADLDRIHTGSAGSNRNNDAARVITRTGSPNRSHWAWFGLQFHEPKKISAVQAWFGYYRDPRAVHSGDDPNLALQYVPTSYVFQYLDGEEWMDMPGTHVADNSRAHVTHYLQTPVEAKAIRVYIHGQRNSKGLLDAGLYRGTCLELDFLEVDSGQRRLKSL